jgi:hypothetical protein
MNDKVELIAIAQVAVVAGQPPTLEFKSSQGFKGARYDSAGVYELTLDHKHGVDKLVINVTRNSPTGGEIQAAPIGTDDTDLFQVTNFEAGSPADTAFFVTVWRVRS